MPPAPSSSSPAAGLVQVVADPNVLVAAALTPGGVCAELLSKLLESPLELVASPLLLAEG
jgi:predicted nucleic acid-binding protein